MECARASGTPIFRSGKMTSSVIVDLCIYLNRLLAPTTTVHGVLMDVFGAGILLTGNSGVGKSETAMELVADDSVLIKRIENELVGTAPERIRYFMELRGIGIINVKNMYGSGAVMTEKAIELVMELEPWRKDKEYDRIGGEDSKETILGPVTKDSREWATTPRASSLHVPSGDNRASGKRRRIRGRYVKEWADDKTDKKKIRSFYGNFGNYGKIGRCEKHFENAPKTEKTKNI